MRAVNSQKSDFQTIEKVEKKSYYPSLPTLEILICVLLWGGGVISSIFSLIPISVRQEKRYLRGELLHDGWHDWLGRYQDISDSEWSLWRKYLWQCTVPGYIGHFVVARFVEKVWPYRRFEIFLAYSIAFTVHFMGYQSMFVLLFHFGIQYLAVFLTKSVVVCWISGLSLLFVIHNRACSDFVLSLYEDDIDKGYFLLIAIGMSNLRYIGFSLEYAWKFKGRKEETSVTPSADLKIKPLRRGPKNRKASQEDAGKESQPDMKNDLNSDCRFVDLLIYQMYFPLFFGGPIVNYDTFARQIRQPPPAWTKERTIRFALGMVRYIFWHMFIDFALHYVYVSALLFDRETIANLTIFELCGFSMAQVGLFYMKYVIFYGMPSHFATSDGLDVPSQPQCVYSKHRMTDFWKLVDKGLHKWLVRYVFIPCGGSKNGVLRAIFSLTMSFAFVTLWHKPTSAHVRWGFLSWLGVLVEYIALEFYRTESVQILERKYFTPRWSRRIRAFFSCFAFGFMIVSNLYFLGGIRMGDIYWKRLYFENFIATMLIHVSLYGAVQSSMNFE